MTRPEVLTSSRGHPVQVVQSGLVLTSVFGCSISDVQVRTSRECCSLGCDSAARLAGWLGIDVDWVVDPRPRALIAARFSRDDNLVLEYRLYYHSVRFLTPYVKHQAYASHIRHPA